MTAQWILWCQGHSCSFQAEAQIPFLYFLGLSLFSADVYLLFTPCFLFSFFLLGGLRELYCNWCLVITYGYVLRDHFWQYQWATCDVRNQIHMQVKHSMNCTITYTPNKIICYCLIPQFFSARVGYELGKLGQRSGLIIFFPAKNKLLL